MTKTKKMADRLFGGGGGGGQSDKFELFRSQELLFIIFLQHSQ